MGFCIICSGYLGSQGGGDQQVVTDQGSSEWWRPTLFPHLFRGLDKKGAGWGGSRGAAGGGGSHCCIACPGAFLPANTPHTWLLPLPTLPPLHPPGHAPPLHTSPHTFEPLSTPLTCPSHLRLHLWFGPMTQGACALASRRPHPSLHLLPAPVHTSPTLSTPASHLRNELWVGLAPRGHAP